MLPTEVAFVEGREIAESQRKRRGGGEADEEYFKGFLKHDLKNQGGSGHNEDDDET